MNKVLCFAVLVALVVASFNALAENKPTGTTGKKAPPKVTKVECKVQGTPVEFPDDILIVNSGNTTIAKGKVISWKVPKINKSGTHKLTADLLAGKSEFVSGALPGGIEAGAACEASVVTFKATTVPVSK